MGFTLPLSKALLSDPAFSSDPRTHPHFNAPFDDPPVSTQPPKPKQIHRQPQINRKASMKALIRRLTSHHNLDRIDELDETDPFGTSYHHDGPYEAIGSIQVHPTPHANAHHPKRAFDPHPTHHESPQWVSSIRDEKELSLHLKPGQILPPSTIYTSHISSLASVPNHFFRQPNTPATVAHPNPSPSYSLPSSQTRSTQDSPLHLMNDLHNRPSSHPRAPSQRYIGKDTPDIHILPPHHERNDVPYVPTQTTTTVFPPPRHESRLHNLDSSPPLPLSVSQKTRATEGMVPYHDAGHESHSLNSAHRTINSTITRSSSNIQNKPPRTHHFPKRLVMPALLQPQPPQPQLRFPPVEHMDWKDEYTEDRTPEGMDAGGQPVMYNRGPKLLRKKSSAYPGELPRLHHLPMLQGNIIPEAGEIPTRTENEAESAKEKIRRRRLSKRKNDIRALNLP